ncbi:MAG: NFACT family protein, partial [Candidatus Marsarchaeota archaeon]
MKKTSLSAIDIAAWVAESGKLLIGSRVEGAYQLNQVIYLFRLRDRDSFKTLVVRPGRYVYLSNLFESELAGVKANTSLNQLLRGEQINGVSQVDRERIIEISLGPRDNPMRVYVELFSAGQLAVVKDGKIVYLMAPYRGRDRVLEVGKPYAFPPSRGKRLEEGNDLEFKGPALASLTHALSFPAEGVKEALARMGIDPNAELSKAEAQRAIEEMKRIWEEASEAGKAAPALYGEGDEATFHPFPFKSEVGERTLTFKTFNELLASVFAPDLTEAQNPEAERLQRAVEEAEKAAKAHEERAAELEREVQLLSSLAPQLSQAIATVRSAQKKLGWEAVKPGELDGLHLKAVIPDGGQLFFEELGDLPVRLNPGIW